MATAVLVSQGVRLLIMTREESKTEKTDKSKLKGDVTAEEEAIQAAEKDAHSALSPTMRIGGQAFHSVKKIYYKLLAGRLSQLQEQVINQDHELSELTHDVGQLAAQVRQMNRLLEGFEQRLTRLEEQGQNEHLEEGPD
jgi:uncharacterized coiled-coil protein SlyX